MQLVSIVIPLYNEQDLIRDFFTQLTAVIDPLPYQFEFWFINDGSQDATQALLESIHTKDNRVQILQLSRNFGHQSALCAGLEQAKGDYILTMDGDGQHPAELIPDMLRMTEAGYDIVLTQRLNDKGQNPFKKESSKLFYTLINRIGDTQTLPGGADFRLLTRQVLDNLLAMPEYHRFLRGMVAWLGFKSVILPFTPAQRIAGKSKYSFKKMLRLASDAVFSFSMLPLYIGLSAGLFFLLLAAIEAVYVLSFWIRGDVSTLEPGWSSLMFMLLIIGAVLMIILGFIGIYVGYIFQEVKHRPNYVIQKKIDQLTSNDKEGLDL
ncbi:MAG: glycosyltransferase family 2 protein [Flexilinea sp.]